MNVSAIQTTLGGYANTGSAKAIRETIQSVAKTNETYLPKTSIPTTPVAAQEETQQVKTVATTLQEDPAEKAAGHQAVLAKQSAFNKDSARVNVGELYRFNNKYIYGTSTQTWAKIETDGLGNWTRAGLEDYAADYYSATGKSIDVDAIMQKYGNSSGVIDGVGQQKIYQDSSDPLGLSYIRDAVAIADTYTLGLGGTTASPTSTVFDKSLDNLVNNFTYGYPGKMYLGLDKNEKGYWNMEDLSKYAQAYEKTFGVKLDIDAIMSKYDTDGDGKLTYHEQNAIAKDDALGLGRIKDALDARKNQKDDDTVTIDFNGFKKSLTMDKATWGKLSSAFSNSIQKAAMLDAFMMTNSLIQNRGLGSFNRAYGGMGYNTMWNQANLSLVSSFI